MQDRIREYVKDAAMSRGRALSVCLLGLGTTNLAIYDALLTSPYIKEITVRQSGKINSTVPNGLKIIGGKDATEGIYEDLIFASPSYRREKIRLPDASIITSDLEIYLLNPCKNTFLVSGSSGKSTVTTIASLLLSPTFPSLFTGGNLGTPLASASLSADAFLLELSSFNLRYTAPRAKRAILTNVTPNHLDWHKDMSEYEECKRRLIDCADEKILALGCPFNDALAKSIKAFALVSLTHSDTELRSKFDLSHTVTVSDGKICIDGENRIPISQIRLKGQHNILNFMSAIALSLGYTSKERIFEIAAEFSGLGHRCECFTVGEREYINSSIDTAPERTAATLTGLGREVNLILGGRGKGLSPDPMKEAILRYARRISLYGDIADEMCEWIEADADLSGIPHKAFTVLKDAIDHADDGQRTVLLSPAAASYGEFKDFEERGCFFKEYLSKKHG